MKTTRSRASIQYSGGCRAPAFIRAMAGGVWLSGISMARDTAGAVLIWVALGTPVFLGLAGLGLDTSMWFMERRIMQSAADMAAIAATNALSNGGDQAALEASAHHILSENGFALTAADNFEVRNPPLGGPNAGNANAVEVVLRRPGKRYLVTQFIDAVSIQTRAVGLMRFSGELCIIALDETADAAVEFRGSASGYLNCGIARTATPRSMWAAPPASMSPRPTPMVTSSWKARRRSATTCRCNPMRRGCRTRSVPRAATYSCRCSAPAIPRPRSTVRRA